MNNIALFRSLMGANYDEKLHIKIEETISDIYMLVEEMGDELVASVFRPLASISQLMTPKSTTELGAITATQIASCCYVMHALYSDFCRSPLYDICERSIIEISQSVGVYESTLETWLVQSRGKAIEH